MGERTYKKQHMNEERYKAIKAAINEGSKSQTQIRNWFLISGSTYSRIKATKDWQDYLDHRSSWNKHNKQFNKTPAEQHQNISMFSGEDLLNQNLVTLARSLQLYTESLNDLKVAIYSLRKAVNLEPEKRRTGLFGKGF